MEPEGTWLERLPKILILEGKWGVMKCLGAWLVAFALFSRPWVFDGGLQDQYADPYWVQLLGNGIVTYVLALVYYYLMGVFAQFAMLVADPGYKCDLSIARRLTGYAQIPGAMVLLFFGQLPETYIIFCLLSITCFALLAYKINPGPIGKIIKGITLASLSLLCICFIVSLIVLPLAA